MGSDLGAPRGRGISEPTKDALRREVGYVCPVEGCGSPYLTWHHFDPPWTKGHIDRVEGMIALCAEHHNAANANAYSIDQLKLLKKSLNTAVVHGDVLLRRSNTVFVASDNISHRCLGLLKFKGVPLVYFKKLESEPEYQLFISTIDKMGRLEQIIMGNFWEVDPENYVVIATPITRDICITKLDSSVKISLKFRDAKDAKEENIRNYVSRNKLPLNDTRICYFEYVLDGIVRVDKIGILAGGFQIRSGVSIDSGYLLEI